MDAWLLEHVDSMADLLAQGLRERVVFYRDVSDEALRVATRTFIEIVVAALRTGDLDALLDAGHKNLERRFGQGLSVEEGMQFTEPLRGAFFAVMRSAFEGRIEGLYDVILAANRIGYGSFPRPKSSGNLAKLATRRTLKEDTPWLVRG